MFRRLAIAVAFAAAMAPSLACAQTYGAGQPTHEAPVSSGGVTSTKIVAAASTNTASLKAGTTQVYSYDCFAAAAYPVYLKLYNKATSPTVGTDVPVRTIGIPAGGRAQFEALPGIDKFPLGLAVAMTKLMPDTDTTVLVANDAVCNIDWY